MEPGLASPNQHLANAFAAVGAYDRTSHRARNRDRLHGLLGDPVRCLDFHKVATHREIKVSDRALLEAQVFTESHVYQFLGLEPPGDLKAIEAVIKRDKEIDTMAKAEKAAGAAKKDKKPAIPRLGILQYLKEMLVKARDDDKPLSADQLLAKLVTKFPDRPADSMKTTVRNQLGYHLGAKGFAVDKTEDEKKGLVYKAARGAKAEPPVRAKKEPKPPKEKKAKAKKAKAKKADEPPAEEQSAA